MALLGSTADRCNSTRAYGSIGQDTALVKHEGYGSSSPRSAWRSTHYRYGQQLGAFAPFFETTSSINFAKHTDTRVDDQMQ